MSFEPKWKTVILAFLLFSMLGCNIGYNSLLFATKSNIGVDLDTAPPTAEISISRSEGVIEPVFEGGQTLPTMAHFATNVGGPQRFFFGVKSAFSTGKAAEALSQNWKSGENGSIANLQNSIRLFHKPKRIPLWGDPEYVEFLDEGIVKPVYFGTHTTFGLKVEWKGTSGQYPSAVKLGFNRAELAWAPITMESSEKNPVIVIKDSAGKLENNEGVIHYGRNKFVEAKIKFEEAVGKDSSLAEAYYNLYLVFEQLKDQAKADKNLIKALELATAQNNPTLFSAKYTVSVPSLLAILDNDVEIGKPTDSNKVFQTQFFATGHAATQLALKKDIRERLENEFQMTHLLSINKTGEGKILSNPPGIDCGDDCDESYPPGKEVTLTATPGGGTSFSSWGGDCSGSNATVKVKLDASRTCTANFN